MVTTTHDPAQGGAPRLIVCLAGAQHPDSVDQQVFYLGHQVTTLGTAPGSDVLLEGTDGQLARIEHDEHDEYVYLHVSHLVEGRVNGAPVSRHPLRTGDRLELGPWTLAYVREEYADHGRPFGGRQGGEGSHQQPQPARSQVTAATEPAVGDLATVPLPGT